MLTMASGEEGEAAHSSLALWCMRNPTITRVHEFQLDLSMSVRC